MGRKEGEEGREGKGEDVGGRGRGKMWEGGEGEGRGR